MIPFFLWYTALYIFTNRQLDESKPGIEAFGDRPNEKGPLELRVAEATRAGKAWRINVLPDKITAEMAAEVGLGRRAASSAKTGTDGDSPIFASRYVAHQLSAKLNPPAAKGGRSKSRDLVLFVHGYNNTLQEVLDRAEAIEKLYDVEVLVFSWPANGGGVKGVASYKSDKSDAAASVGALDRCFGLLEKYLEELHRANVQRIEATANKKFPDDDEKWQTYFAEQADKCCSSTINLVLHSMGNYLFKHCLKSSIYHADRLLFDNVVLVAADTNNAAHTEWASRIQARARVLVTINEKDKALMASRMKMGEHQRARLGHYPFELSAPGVVYVDFTDAAHVGDSHAYFEGKPTQNDKVLQFFDDAFHGRLPEKPLRFDPAKNLYRLP